MKTNLHRTLLVALATLLAATLTHAQAPAPTAAATAPTAEQTAALAAVNTKLAAQVQAAADARTALARAAFAQPVNPADLRTKAGDVGAAEQALASARAQEFAQIQAGPNRFNAQQSQVIAAAAGRGGALTAAVAGGRGGGAGGAPARKRLLIWADTRNGQAQHEFTSHAMALVEEMGRKSGLWDSFIRTDSEIISYSPKMTTGRGASGGPSLANVDAIFSLTHREAPLADDQKADLLKFVRDDGKGFVTGHTGLTALSQWPEFREMLGGDFGGHTIGYAGTMVVEDPKFPGASAFPMRSEMQEEWYNLQNFSREKIHVIMRLDLSVFPVLPASVANSGGDFPVTWAREYGKGRVFASTFAHATETWDNPMIQTMYFEAIKWALKLQDADVTPRPLPKEAVLPKKQ